MTSQLRAEVESVARYRCQADGLHHPDCPGSSSQQSILGSAADAFAAHHVQPREQGGPDELSNLIWVWNGPTGLGAGGCHQMIHTHRYEAKELGLLRDSPNKWKPKKGILTDAEDA